MEFRFKALQKQREPDELDTPTLLTGPRGWIAVFVIMFMIAGAVVWGFLGDLPRSVSAAGVLGRPDGVSLLQASRDGTVGQILVHPGDRVRKGQPVARLTAAAETAAPSPAPSPTLGDDGLLHTPPPAAPRPRTVTVRAAFAGNVVGVPVTDGQLVRTGQTLATLERTDGRDAELAALLFVPSDKAAGLAPGRAVTLSVSTAPSAAFGMLRGRITSIGPYPVAPEEAARLGAGSAYRAADRPRLVTVALVRDRGTVSGYAWTTKDGPPMRVGSQAAVTGAISLGSSRPISLVLGS